MSVARGARVISITFIKHAHTLTLTHAPIRAAANTHNVNTTQFKQCEVIMLKSIQCIVYVFCVVFRVEVLISVVFGLMGTARRKACLTNPMSFQHNASHWLKNTLNYIYIISTIPTIPLFVNSNFVSPKSQRTCHL